MKKVQFPLEKFFIGRQCRPAIEEHWKSIIKDEGMLKHKWGRSSAVGKALEQAKQKGEVMVLASLEMFNKSVEAHALLLKDKK